MKNVERIAGYVKKYGESGVKICSISGTNNWLIGQKIENDKWIMTLGKPMGNVTYNLGTTTNAQFSDIWKELKKMEIESKITQLGLATHLKEVINNFIKNYEKNYKKFIKIEERKSQPICKMSRKHSRFKSTRKI